MSFGLSPDEYWDLSLRELWNVLRAQRDRRKDEYERDVVLAWQIERLSIMAVKKHGRQLPSLSKLLPTTKPSGKQTWQEMKAAMQTFKRKS